MELLGTDTEGQMTCEIRGHHKDGIIIIEQVLNKKKRKGKFNEEETKGYLRAEEIKFEIPPSISQKNWIITTNKSFDFLKDEPDLYDNL